MPRRLELLRRRVSSARDDTRGRNLKFKFVGPPVSSHMGKLTGWVRINTVKKVIIIVVKIK